MEDIQSSSLPSSCVLFSLAMGRLAAAFAEPSFQACQELLHKPPKDEPSAGAASVSPALKRLRSELDDAVVHGRPLRRRAVLAALREGVGVEEELAARAGPKTTLLGHAFLQAQSLQEELDLSLILSLLRAKADPNRPLNEELPAPIATLLLCWEIKEAQTSDRPLEELLFVGLSDAGAEGKKVCHHHVASLDSSPWTLALQSPEKHWDEEVQALVKFQAHIDCRFPLGGVVASALGHQILAKNVHGCQELLKLRACPDCYIERSGKEEKLVAVAVAMEKQDKEAALDILRHLIDHKPYMLTPVLLEGVSMTFEAALRNLAKKDSDWLSLATKAQVTLDDDSEAGGSDSDGDDRSERSDDEDGEDDDEEEEESEKKSEAMEVFEEITEGAEVVLAEKLGVPQDEASDKRAFQVIQLITSEGEETLAELKVSGGCEHLEKPIPLSKLIALEPPSVHESSFAANKDYAFWDLHQGKVPKSMKAIGGSITVGLSRNGRDRVIEVPKGTQLEFELPAHLQNPSRPQYTAIIEFQMKPFHGVTALLHTSAELGDADLVVETSASESGSPQPTLKLRSSGSQETALSASLSWNSWHRVVLTRSAEGFASLIVDRREVLPADAADPQKANRSSRRDGTEPGSPSSTEPPALGTLQSAFRVFGSKHAQESSKGGLAVRFVLLCREALGASAVQLLLRKTKQLMKSIQQQPLVLQELKLMKKQAHPIFLDASFFGCFCDAFISAGAQPKEVAQSHRLILFMFETLIKENQMMKDPDLVGVPLDLLQLTYEHLERSSKLFAKFDQLWASSDMEEQVPLIKDLLKLLNELRSTLAEKGPAFGPLIIPFGIVQRTQQSAKKQFVILILEKPDATYRLTVVNPGQGKDFHKSSVQGHPKVKYQTSMVFEGLCSEKVEDDAFWLTLFTVVPTVGPQSAWHLLYDLFLPFVLGSKGETRMLEDALVGSQEDWRTPQRGSGCWKVLMHAIRQLMRSNSVSVTNAKLLQWRLRQHFLQLALKDVDAVPRLSRSQRTCLRIAASQLGLTAVKLSVQMPDTHEQLGFLKESKQMIEKAEEALAAKPVLHSGELPLAELQLSALAAKAHEQTTAHPNWDYFVGPRPNPGQSLSIPAQIPLDLLALRERAETTEEAIQAIYTADEICRTLSGLRQSGRCKFGHLFIINVLQQLFTEIIPTPLGPMSSHKDKLWSCNEDFHSPHEYLTRLMVSDLQQTLLRLCSQFAAAAFSIHTERTNKAVVDAEVQRAHLTRSFDSTILCVFGAIAALSDRLARMTPQDYQSDWPDKARKSEESSGLLPVPLNCLTQTLMGSEDSPGFAISVDSFVVQSETIEVAIPELHMSRSAIINYFVEVAESMGLQGDRGRILFDWDDGGWRMNARDHYGTSIFCRTLAASYLHNSSAEGLLTGQDAYLMAEFPDFRPFRDIVFWFKFALCTDLRVFPRGSFSQGEASLRWKFNGESGRYEVSGLGQTLLGEGRTEPSGDGHRWRSSATASNHTPSPVQCEDDLLYMRSRGWFFSSHIIALFRLKCELKLL